MKPILFLFNNRDSIKAGRTTSTLMLACHRKGHPVFATDIVSLKANSSTSLFADAYQLKPRGRVDATPMLSARRSRVASESVDLRDMQAVFVRTTHGTRNLKNGLETRAKADTKPDDFALDRLQTNNLITRENES